MKTIGRILVCTVVLFTFVFTGCQNEQEEVLESPAQKITGEEDNLAEGMGKELSKAPGEHVVDQPPEEQTSEKLTDAAKTMEEQLEEGEGSRQE